MLAKKATEKQKKENRENQAACAHMSGTTANEPRDDSTQEPESYKDKGGNIAVKVKQEPDQDNKWQRVGQQM